MHETISGHVFRPADLRCGQRRPGISAFMRIRNGEAFLEAAIRSHIDHFDEIVAVYNQCTDATPDILDRLAREYGPKLRVYHYLDRVFPPGSEGHAKTPADSPNSLVNYYNFALAQTRFRTVTKLDDDHLAMDADLAAVVDDIRRRGGTGDLLWAFSGLNLWHEANGPLTIFDRDPVSGSGDIGFFEVREDRFFTHDRRFERTPRAGLSRRFCGFVYWHLKYLKPGHGLANYELDENPRSRYRRRRAVMVNGRGVNLDTLIAHLTPKATDRLKAFVSDKHRFLLARDAALADWFGGRSVAETLAQSVMPVHLDMAGLSGEAGGR